MNVGAMWLWHAQDHRSFHDGYRVEIFHAFEDTIRFSFAAEHLARSAAEQVRSFWEKFSSLAAVAAHLDGKEKRAVWDHYHAAIALALTGDIRKSAKGLSAVLQTPDYAPWVEAL